MQDPILLVLRDQVFDIIVGTIFVFVGLAACGIAMIRRRSGMRVFTWLGIWSAMYGIRPLVDSLDSLGILPYWLHVSVPTIDAVTMYFILVAAALVWRELSLDKMRLFIRVVALLGLEIGLTGIAIFIYAGSNDTLIRYNNFLTTCSLCVLVTVVAVPRLSRKFLVMPDRGVLLVGMLVFATEALYVNLLRSMGYRTSPIWDTLGFAILLFSLGYVAMRIIAANERRLQSIENELAIARDIQASIIPDRNPEVRDLRIAAVYRPMTYVAGDFYDFIHIDGNRVGFLVADVAGHGVPAALIASMIKVAIRAIVPCANDPREVLRGLNRALFGQLRNTLVTASYFWMDTENRNARYSAAGHPPLLRWRQDKLERIESNGLLFGVIPDPDYPVRDILINPGDRFLLYTDGLIEPENASGDSFGDSRLEHILRQNQSCSPSELAELLLSDIQLWQPAPGTQQDDITLIVVDVI